MLTITPRYKAAISLANQVPPERFNALLARLMKQFIQDKVPFTELEESKLADVLNFDVKDLCSLIDACSLTFERAAATSANMAEIIDLLDSSGLASAQIEEFRKIWMENASALINACKAKPFGAPGRSYLLDAQWRVHLEVASSGGGKKCEPAGLLQLRLGSTNKVDDGQGGSMVLSFSKSELRNFYEKLERVQGQLDSLS